MNSKKGRISLIVSIFVTAVVVFTIFWITSGSTNKAFASIMNPLKEKIGLGEDEEDLGEEAGGAKSMYLQSFEEFVDGINKMTAKNQNFLLELNKKSAIIGFRKGVNRWECYGCLDLGVKAQKHPNKIFNKPNDPKCSKSACICLCDGAFRVLEEKAPASEREDIGQCQGELICKKLDVDIVEKTIIHKYSMSSDVHHWGNGFLFTNVLDANGLPFKDQFNTDAGTRKLIVEKRCISDPVQEGEYQCYIGVCNEDMLDFNEDKLKIDGCINKDYS